LVSPSQRCSHSVRPSRFGASFHTVTNLRLDRSIANVPVLGVPASLAVAYVFLPFANAIRPRTLTNNTHQFWRCVHVLRSRSLRLRYPQERTYWQLGASAVP
jgi:hypothetical protein